MLIYCFFYFSGSSDSLAETFQSLSTHNLESDPQYSPTKRNKPAQKGQSHSPQKRLGKENFSPKQKSKLRNTKQTTSQAKTMRPVPVPTTPTTNKKTSKKGSAIKKKSTATKPPIKPPASVVGAAKRKQRAPVLREIIKLQESTKSQIPKAPFSRLVREIIQRTSNQNDVRITPESLEALREAAEVYITNVMTNAYLITLNRRQVTLTVRDIQLLMFIIGAGSGLSRTLNA